MRKKLETVWDKDTIFPKTIRADHDPLSKGQCGVSAAYLAKELIEQGYGIVYCEGRVDFPIAEQSIDDHCWIRTDDQTKNAVIIDLTADQNHFATPVLCATEAALKEKGIVFHIRREGPLTNITHENFLQRLQILTDKIAL